MCVSTCIIIWNSKEFKYKHNVKYANGDGVGWDGVVTFILITVCMQCECFNVSSCYAPSPHHFNITQYFKDNDKQFKY